MNIYLMATLLLLGQSAPASQPALMDGYLAAPPALAAATTQPSGGAAACLPQAGPTTIYVDKVRKTFFVYAGASYVPSDRRVRLMVGYYDHTNGTVPRPTIAATLSRGDTPCLAIAADGEGYLWLFSSGLPGGEPTQVFRSSRPCDITAFAQVCRLDWFAAQPWYLAGQGFLVLQAGPGGRVYVSTSPDGRAWGEPKQLVTSEGVMGFLSGSHQGKVGVAFTVPAKEDPHSAAQLNYIQTSDGGRNWTTARGEPVTVPVTACERTRVFDYGAIKREIVLEDLTFDAAGNPAVLYLVGLQHQGGAPGTQTWAVARAFGRNWIISGMIESDDPGDRGALYLEQPGTWSLIAPTAAGPQPGRPGGDIALWSSFDAGRSWNSRLLTRSARFNQNVVRRPIGAHPDFYAWWQDADTPSRIYFATQDGNVFALPAHFSGDVARPEAVPLSAAASRPGTAPASWRSAKAPTTRPRGRHVPPPRRGSPGIGTRPAH